jgi:sensor histidine kinase YesM
MSVILVSIIIVLGNSLNYFALVQYDRAFFRYNKLMEFYSCVNSMHSSLIRYLFSSNDKELMEYSDWKDKSLAAIDDLQTVSSDELQFRYKLLGNMITTYSEWTGRMQQGLHDRTVQSWYDSFNRLHDLIMDTYSHYSALTTNEMQAERSFLTRRWRFQLLFSIVTVVVVLAGAIVFSIFAIRSITKPIEAMVENINKIKSGDFAINHTAAESREINILVQSFSDMAVEINKNIKELTNKNEIEKRLIESENENLKIGRDLAQARFLSLQQQMNPHFLFNTLSTLSKMAYIEGAEKSSELMVKTANVLRYSLEMADKISTIGKEAECVENYFEIQKKRIGDRANFKLSLDDDLRMVPIPGMLLQPLVENCVIHGIKESIGEAFIRVDISKKGDRAFITVEDNGVGIVADKMSRIMNRVPLEYSGSTSIGISNVLQRLDICYHGDFHYNIESEEGCGTIVSIDIPIMAETGYDPFTDS